MKNNDKSKLIECIEEFLEGWEHFLECIDFDHTSFDSRAIDWWNTVPGKMQQALKEVKPARKEVRHEKVSAMS